MNGREILGNTIHKSVPRNITLYEKYAYRMAGTIY